MHVPERASIHVRIRHDHGRFIPLRIHEEPGDFGSLLRLFQQESVQSIGDEGVLYGTDDKVLGGEFHRGLERQSA